MRALLHLFSSVGATSAGRPSRGRVESIAGRALWLNAGGGGVKHAGQTTLHLMPMHPFKGKLLALIANIRWALDLVRAVAQDRPLEGVLGRCRRINYSTCACAVTAKPDHGNGVTAGFRVKPLQGFWATP